MKKINLIFPGLGYRNINQALVYIYDKNNNLILKDKTYNGRLEICLIKNNIYRIKVVSKCEKINKIIYINDNDTYLIPFSSSYIFNRKENTITLILTDYNYNNLPIEKGLINLWQKQ